MVFPKMKKNPSKESFWCQSCSFKSRHFHSFLKHIRIHKKPKSFSTCLLSSECDDSFICIKCNFSTTSLTVWNRHTTAHITIREPSKTCFKNRRIHFNCSYCSHIETDLETLLYHVQDNHKKGTIDFKLSGLDKVRRRLKDINGIYFNKPVNAVKCQENLLGQLQVVDSNMSSFLTTSHSMHNVFYKDFHSNKENVSEVPQIDQHNELEENEVPSVKCSNCKYLIVVDETNAGSLHCSRCKSKINSDAEHLPKYRCPKCKCHCKNAKNFEKHVCSTKHFKRNNYLCKCNKEFVDKDDLKQHLTSTGHKQKHYSCLGCNKMFEMKLSLEQHAEKTGHKAQIRSNIQSILRNKIFSEDNEKNFHSNDKLKQATEGNGVSRDLKQGIPTTGQNTKGDLSECSKKSSIMSSQQSIVSDRLKNSIDKPENSILKNTSKQGGSKSCQTDFPCTKCEQRFKTKRHLHQHMYGAAHRDVIFECECMKEYSLRNELQQHISATGHKAKVYICPQCKKEFNVKFGLENHLKSTGHKGVNSKRSSVKTRNATKNSKESTTSSRVMDINQATIRLGSSIGNQIQVSCTKLDEHFESMKNLQQHGTENGYRKTEFECECSKKFYVKADFKQHIRTTKHKPKVYVCKTCERKFLLKFSLKDHMKSANHTEASSQPKHKQTTFICECLREFDKKANFEKHLVESTHKRKVYLCSVCSRKFESKLSLEQHIKSTGHN